HGLLILTSIPVACLGFLFGGVSPAEVIRSALLTLLSTAAALAVGVAASASCRRSSLAVSVAAAIALGGLIGIPALILAYFTYTSPAGSQLTAWTYILIVLNPLFAETHLFFK